RYAYALNNPLKYTDPSGHFLKAASWLFFFSCTAMSSGGDWKFSSDVANTVTNGMSQLGQFTIYKNNYFKITAGLDVYSIGVSVNASYNQGDWQAAASVGVGIQRDISAGVNVGYRTGNWMFGVSGGYSYNSKGNEWQYGFGATYNQSNSSYTLGFTHYGGDDAQTNWYASYQNGDFSFSMTNDAFLNIVNGNSSDKYRTAGFELGYGNLSIGVSIYTNNPVSESRENWPSPIYGENASGKGAYADGRRIYSAAYFGVSDGNTVSRIGIDSPWIQDAIQNGLHQSKFARILWGGSPYFPTDYSTPASFYLFNRFYSPYSLY
ncbi:MAG TPA: polymorphic toxin type 23 domain-containing protein, partial [Bacteroidia bacterium]|nr:polymorphic toxin type 23 domain-containing protein [Bacteroidia bacterium]